LAHPRIKVGNVAYTGRTAISVVERRAYDSSKSPYGPFAAYWDSGR